MTPSRLPVATEITSDRLVLEPLRVGHAPELAAVLDDTRLHEFTGGEPASPEELTARYERQVTGRSADGTQQWFNWVLRRRGDGRAAGYLQATTWPDETGDLVAELAWVVAVPHQGAGLAREAAAAVARWLAARGVGRFVAHVHPGHAASAAVA
ncbi:MAG: GNAT family N-acetyltransferase, partial [Sporichthyaceae bacterium]